MSVLYLFIAVALVATLVALGSGIITMVEGGEEDRTRSHRLMFARVALQAVTVALVLLAVLSQTK